MLVVKALARTAVAVLASIGGLVVAAGCVIWFDRPWSEPE